MTRKKRIRAAIIGGSVLAGIAAISFGLSRLEPAAPSVNRATVWMDGVKRGEMIRQVRGPGTLVVVPEAIRWVAARTRGRVERRVLLPGVYVKPETIILELSNPELEQELGDAAYQLRAQEAELADLRVRLESQVLNQRSVAAGVTSEYNQARLQAEADEKLHAEKLVGDLILKRSKVRAEELATRNELEQQRLQIAAESVEAQIQAKRATVEQFHA
ncbi:MAG: RND transporter, partial [Vicinamibacteria bacterium]